MNYYNLNLKKYYSIHQIENYLILYFHLFSQKLEFLKYYYLLKKV